MSIEKPSPIQKHSAGGVVIDGSKVLVLSWTDRDFVCLPKGGLEGIETSEQAALREVKEETGYNVRIVEFLGSWSYIFSERNADYRKTVDYYLMEKIDSKPPRPNRNQNEHFESKWISLHRARASFTYSDARQALDQSISILQNSQS